ncbi:MULTISPECIES: QsdR family transcriptional regulator [Actinomadura]|uniref:QsdR family transcriptional regulator n=1 Tax=Actinomadura yumaensis TaxID=111807 RepID=A0ABW2CLX8_9ACTN|nr:QsdR family transcriptional regulator [Actinomadura sp. J1-007]
MAAPPREPPETGRPDRRAAVRLARRCFLAGRRIEMNALAAELGVSRVTLNRWVGSRDRLIGEINWSLAEPALREARARAAGTGADAVAATMEEFTRTVLAAPFMHVFLRREGDIALRVLTTNRSDLQRNIIGFVERTLHEERVVPPAPLDLSDLAYVVVRIGESFTYIDMITGGAPDPAKIGHAVRALLT